MGLPPGPSYSSKTWTAGEKITVTALNQLEDYINAMFVGNVSITGNKTLPDGMTTEDLKLIVSTVEKGRIYHNGTRLIFKSLDNNPIKFAENTVVSNSDLEVFSVNGIKPEAHKNRHAVNGADPVSRKATVFVGTNGDFTTISAAVTYCTTNFPNGSRIFVTTGTYNENVTLTTSMDLIGMGKPIITGQVSVLEQSTVSGFHVQSGIVISTAGGYNVIERNVVNGDLGIDVRGVHNVIRNNYVLAGASHQMGIFLEGAGSGIVMGYSKVINNIINGYDRGIAIYNYGHIVSGNIINGWGTEGIYVLGPGTPANVGLIISNNHINAFTNYGIRSGSTTAQYLLVHGNYTVACVSQISILGAGSIVENNHSGT
jgi:hypothetical protein